MKTGRGIDLRCIPRLVPPRLATAFVAALALVVSASGQTRYKAIDVRQLGLTRDTYGMNNRGGMVCGISGNRLVYYDGAKLVSIAVPEQNIDAVVARAINDAGTIVGAIVYNDGATQAFRYENGAFVTLAPGPESWGFAINHRGEIAGIETQRFAFLWYAGKREILPDLGYRLVMVRGINARSDVVGVAATVSSSSVSLFHAYVTNRSGAVDLGILGAAPEGGFYSEGYGINDSGLVCGEADVSSRLRHPFIYSAGRMVDLDPDSVSIDGLGNTAISLNNWNVLVGMVNHGPVLWTSGKRFALQELVDLTDTGLVVITDALSINDSGQILARAMSPSGYTTALLQPQPSTEPLARLVNISARAIGGSGDQTAIAGFVMGSGATAPVLIRCVGSTLRTMGMTEASDDSSLKLFSARDTLGSNDNWTSSPNARDISDTATRTGAFPLPDNGNDAAYLGNVGPGAYTVHAGSTNPDAVVLTEVYHAGSENDAQFVNVSARLHVGSGAKIGIVGFVLNGRRAAKILIRAIGPGLRSQGVNQALEDPQMWLLRGDRPFAGNDDWGSQQSTPLLAGWAATAGAFELNDGSKDAAILAELEPGAYTVHVSGAGGGSGVVMVELYLLGG